MIGKTILHYHITEKLGAGGMGIVYKAEDTKLKRDVAIKFLPVHLGDSPDDLERFKIEAQASAALNHPNIATIYAIEEFEGQVFLAMEFIDGQELKSVITVHDTSLEEKADYLPIDKILSYAMQIAKGLKAAHDKQILHRDIKSSNIMVTGDDQVKIMDFGLAKIAGMPELTKIGTTLGTTAYMSPEQIRGEVSTVAADIWAFGVVFYELLTGRLPFEGDYEQAIYYSVLHENHTKVSEIRPDIEPQIEFIVDKCLQKSMTDRYRDIASILEDLSSYGGWSAIETKKHIQSLPKKKAQNAKNIKTYILPVTAVIAVLLLLFVFVEFDLSDKIFLTGSSEKHLLVLPLTNISGDPEKQPFCDGLMEILTSKLSQMEQFNGEFWVVPSSEVRRNKISSPGEALQMFGANLVVSGSIQIMNNMMRISLNLIDATNMRQLNSSVIDVSNSNISALQDASVIKLFEMLNMELNPETHKKLRAGSTAIPLAFEYYLEGFGYLQRYENQENIDTAISLFNQAVREDSLYALAYSGLGEAYWRKYENIKDLTLVKQAKVFCSKAMELDKDLAPVNVTMGLVNLGTGHYDAAITDFTRALTIDFKNADALRGLARTYEAQNKKSQAETTLKKAVELKPDYWAGYNDLGVFYYNNGEYEKSIPLFKQVIKLTPDNYRGYNNLGGIFYYLKRWTEAREMFEQSLTIHKSYNIYSNLGTLYYIEGNYKEAARTYEQALEINDNDFVTWGNLASAYFWSEGERDKAKDTFRKAIELAEERKKINSNDVEIIQLLASYYAMINNSEKALSLVKESLEKAPDNVQVMYYAATTYEQLKKRDEALLWMENALGKGYPLSDVIHQPELRDLLKDERFKKIAAKY